MKFSLFMALLEFVPDRTRLTCNGQALGDYNGKESFWIDSDVQNMKVKVIKVSYFDKKVILEVVE